MNRKIRVGVSGGIGSGKTFVCSLIEGHGFPVYNADKCARDLMNSNAEIKGALQREFGEEVYENGILNRTFLAKIIFNNEQARLKVNAIVHPVVYQDFEDWVSKQNSAIVFQENALMFDNGSHLRFDRTILVYASLETRIERTMLRDESSREEVLTRINAQGNQEEHKKLADFVVDNSLGQNVSEQIEAILKVLKSAI